MISKTRIMLYVDDPKLVSTFWTTYLHASITNITDLPDDSQNIVLTLNKTIELSFFSVAFIKQFSPEVLGSTPSLMFFSEQFEALHQTIPNAGKIVTNNGLQTFNFKDPEGHYFVIAKQ